MSLATLIEMPTPEPAHPAQYSTQLLLTMARMLRGCTVVLDPFGGKGGVFALQAWLPGVRFEAVEIEPEWAAADTRITLGNALALPWAAGTFDGICTSPAYGNRMADTLRFAEWDYITYAQKLGRPLHPDNGGGLQWGDKYRDFHRRAWAEAARVLRPGGVFVLNCKDHIRAGKVQEVTAWHVKALGELGLVEAGRERIACPGMRFGKNSGARVEYEEVIQMRKGNL